MSSSTDAAAFRIIGIALVVDQLGKGPRMVLRYPTRDHQHPKRHIRTTDRSKQPLPLNNSSTNSSINSSGTNIRSSDTGGNNTKSLKGSMSKKNIDATTTTPTSHNNHHNPPTSVHDLFFHLSGRQMSKLFRPKPSLCGQPITLTIDQTYFCCCAVLMNQNVTNPINTGSSTTGSTENSNAGTNDDIDTGMKATSVDASTSTTNSSAGKDQPLVLFSVVVAVAPTTTSPPSLPPVMNASTMTMPNEMGHTRSNYSHDNPIFPCIRRVHIALARICRVLEREERRCHYVSSQVLLYERIRSELTSSSSSSSLKSSLVSNSNTTLVSSSTSNSSMPPKDTITSSATTTTSTTTTATNAAPLRSTVTTTSISSMDASNNGPTLSSVVHVPANTVATHRRSGSHNSPFMMPQSSTVISELAHTDLSSSSLSSSVLPHASQPPAFSSFETTTFQQPQWELEQIILETFMTAPPTRYVRTTSQPDVDPVELEHAGNLAQELAQVYHALAATHCGTTDPCHLIPTTRPPNASTQSLLLISGRDSVVYINGHMAVTIEAATTVVSAPLLQFHPEFNDANGVSTNRIPIIRPYMTLLFPNHAADQILDSLRRPVHGEWSTANQILPQPRRIQQFLRAWSPQKSLLDMAEETYLPLEATLDVAKQLVRQGLCIVSPVLSYSVGFVCPNVQRLQQMTLPFYQRFGIPNIHLFVLVSFLTTSNRTFGMSISQMIRYPSNFESNSTNDPINTHVRIPIVTSILRQTSSTSSVYDKNANDDDGTVSQLLRSNENINQAALEDIVYQMIIWLCSHQVIAPLQEYLVLVRPNPNMMVGTMRSSGDERRSDQAPTEERKHDEMMKASSVSTRSGIGTTDSNNDTNNDNGRNDEWIRQTIFNHCFHHSNDNHETEAPHPDRPSPPGAAQHQVLLSECCHCTGIEERILRSFVARSAHQFRIRMTI